jgi:membrane protease YdiL (CAAX protease family)
MNKLLTTNLIFQLVAYIGMEFVILLIIYAIIKKYNDGKFSLDLIGMKSKKSSATQLFLGIGIALLMQFVLYAGLVIFRYAKFIGSDFANYPVFNVLISIIISIVIGVSAGFTEEILFRGVILKYLMDKKGKVFALIVSSLAFSIFHTGRFDPILIIQAVLIGIVLGYLYILTDSIYLSIGLHSGWDFCSSIIKNGDSLFNIRSVFIFNVSKANDAILNIAPIILYFVVLIIAFIMYKPKRII